jgi:oligo-1,6-glucosidase
MKQQVLSKYDILTVGETPGETPDSAAEIVNEENGALNMLFQFEHMDLDAVREGGLTRPQLPHWNLLELKQVMTRWQKGLEGQGWNSLYLSNHDQPRAVSRFADDGRYRVESAKMLATFLHFQQGTPYIYQGEEIGMTGDKPDERLRTSEAFTVALRALVTAWELSAGGQVVDA